MEAPQESNQIQSSFKETETPQPFTDLENQRNHELEEVEVIFDYSKRAQWLRAAVLGANDGLLSTTSLIMGVGAVRQDPKTMILSGVAGLIGGACSMAIGEFVSVYSQYDTELAQLKRETRSASELEEKKKRLPSPLQAAIASAFAFSLGAVIPLFGAVFVKDYAARVGVVIGLATLGLIGFGWLGAVLGHAPVVRSSLRVLLGGWLAIGITYGLTKAIGSTGL
ncbi:hypothetical protein P3X46_010331 [Hevea brasiliensis]|uniref:Vacuolar iron transporter n=1 Tax=Hevea brasiliensis TaxID=3981 RepID=A0ABQ9ME64_HEVBR|nr:vacuolar iron transporter homolog 4-like [Hevea brasiliensis]KAJ9178451.1 hypothetical protein P3X46_010331 [Hevea brasiliensis]